MFCYQRNLSHPTQPVDEAQFYALVGSARCSELIDQFRATGDAQYKRRLPAFIFQATFDETTSKSGRVGRWRKQSATRLTGLCVMDVDHVDHPREVFAAWQSLDFDALGILLVYVTPSGKGLKVVFKADAAKGNLIDNQHAMARVLGVAVDESCKDASRMSFICKETDILYINKALFTYENKPFAERYDALYRDNHSQATKATVTPPTVPEPVEGTKPVALERCSLATNETQEGQTAAPHFKGCPYSEIIREWWKCQGGEPQEGERNVRLYQLAVSLRAICDNNKALLLQVMPRLGLDEQELISIIDSACKEPPKGISRALREVLTNLSRSLSLSKGKPQHLSKGEPQPLLQDQSPESPLAVEVLNTQLEAWGKEIEALMDDYPMLRDLCAGLKRSQYPAALFVGGGALMTLMTRCWYRFYHRPQQERRLNCSLYIIGHPASNKSMADDICDVLMAPIEAADREGKEALNRYKQDLKKKAANKEGKDKPKGIIRIHPSRTSNGQLIQDMLNACEIVDSKEMQLHMFTFDTELDNSITLQKGGSWIDKQSMELKAFHNEKDGQMYQNSDSPVDEFRVTWNYIYTGTPIALKKKVNERNFGSGLSTRLAVIPMPKTNFEMISFEEQRSIDWERLERMKMWAYKLDSRAGELPLWSLVKHLYDWTKNRMTDAAEDQSEANELMLKRVPYHALNYAAPYIDMRHFSSLHTEGKQWRGTYETDETDWKLCELIARIQYATQQHFFGVLAEKYFDDMNNDVQTAGHRHQQRSIDGYNRLPDIFTRDDVMRCFGYDQHRSASKKISRLKEAHYIEQIDDQGEERFRKLIQLMS